MSDRQNTYRIVDVRGDGDTATLDDLFWIVDQDERILANCVTREIAEFFLRRLIEANWLNGR